VDVKSIGAGGQRGCEIREIEGISRGGILASRIACRNPRCVSSKRLIYLSGGHRSPTILEIGTKFARGDGGDECPRHKFPRDISLS